MIDHLLTKQKLNSMVEQTNASTQIGHTTWQVLKKFAMKDDYK